MNLITKVIDSITRTFQNHFTKTRLFELNDEFMEKMKKSQEKLLDYLEGEEENTSLYDIFEDNKLHDNQYYIISILHLVSKITNDHHKHKNFFNKIFQVLHFFKDMISKISNSELFNIFKSNKKILLFLIEEGLLIIDEEIVKIMINGKYLIKKYPQYFSPEIRPFKNEKWFPKYNKDDQELQNNEWVEEIKKELPDDFYEKRKAGENDNFICTLIQKDSLDDFITYITKNSISLDSTIKPSNYETNNFLFKNTKISLIEYAAFFGSIQILKYLKLNNVQLTPSLWLYAIHSNNAEIINFLEENQINPEDGSYNECLKESIKCHHNDIANYIQNQYLLDDNACNILVESLKYYNFHFVEKKLINESSFVYLCEYDYCLLVNIFLKENLVDINMKIILVINI